MNHAAFLNMEIICQLKVTHHYITMTKNNCCYSRYSNNNKDTIMTKLSPFLEGVMSVLVMMPSLTHASPKYIEEEELKIKKISALSSHEPWIEVGMSMRHVASSNLENLNEKQKQKLEPLLR